MATFAAPGYCSETRAPGCVDRRALNSLKDLYGRQWSPLRHLRELEESKLFIEGRPETPAPHRMPAALSSLISGLQLFDRAYFFSSHFNPLFLR